MDDVLATVPSVSKLGSKDPTQSLRHVNLNEKLTEINGDDRLPKISDNGKSHGYNMEKASKSNLISNAWLSSSKALVLTKALWI